MDEIHTMGTISLRSIFDEIADQVKATEIFAQAGNQISDLKNIHVEEGLR